MNPNGNDPKFPKLEDGSRDLDKSWSWIQTWKEMEKLLKTGKAKAIGVANLSKPYLEELLPHVEVVPAVNQIENHPYLPQQEIVDLCKEKGIHITGYSPFGSTGSPLFQETEIQEAAKKHGVSPGSILLSYHSESVKVVINLILLTLLSCTRKLSDPQIRNSISYRREHEAGEAGLFRLESARPHLSVEAS